MNQRIDKRWIAAAAAIALAGCAGMSQTEKDTATGAGIGAAAGAVIGAMAGGHAAKGAAIGAAVGAAGGYIWSKNMREQQASMEEATQGTGVEVSRTQDNRLKLEIPSDVSFDVGRSDIKPGLRPVLDKFAQNLTRYPETTVHIVGHTDSTGSDAVNNPLSFDRAASTRNYLTARGVAQSRVTIDGHGAREPIADNSNAQGRAKNRRVEIFVGEPAQKG